ncbi:MAG: tetratricopeptide repeat protein [Bdellovibrionales bacterium]|nr:tetratricopeptide repeat protein [Bdellovibrionales bacterium]NQZ17847.1 tetratricopeptide repeat protein [Bdellovibrionales bacterium]
MGIQETDATLNMAQLLFERGDILKCTDLVEAHHDSYEDKDPALYLKATNYLLRCYAEVQEHNKITALKGKLKQWSEVKGDLSARTYYTLALCESQNGHYQEALELCRKSLNLAIETNEKNDICYAITGLAISYYQLGRLQDALKEIYNLQIFFDALELPKLQLTSLIVNAHIYRKLGKYPQALEALWNCYEMIKDEKDLFTHFTLLYGLGLTYKESGDLDKARTYLELGVRSVDSKNMKRLHFLLTELLTEVQKSSKSPYDMIYDVQSHSIYEKTKGKIDFKNQFILLEMLKLFLAHPGRVFSKEELIETIWKQNYNPSVHDNKIYVTIKRLRKVIEPDYNKPKYIFLAKNGYYLSKDIKIQVRGLESVMREETTI